MVLTNDQYIALSKLEKWYRKYTHQIIEISGIIGTGVFDVVKEFLDNIGFDNQRFGVTGNVGYDTKGSNIRGGLGLRVIF